ncbi:MAG: ABC transporter permease [Lachnospiraceae bacterium]|nr:ABC transporter permease [Lachnospiraceae bacterium]
MKKLIRLEFRKNKKCIFLYLAGAAAVLYQGIGLFWEHFSELGGGGAFRIIGRNLFTTYLLFGAILSYVIVKDFEVGIIKEYFFVGYTREEIYWVKYIYLLCTGSIIINLTVAGMVLCKSIVNGYGEGFSGEEIVFWGKVLLGNMSACFLFFAVALLCAVAVGNVLALVLYFMGISFWDMIALFFVGRYHAPEWISVRNLVSRVYDREMMWSEFAGMITVQFGTGVLVLLLGQGIFRRKEYR